MSKLKKHNPETGNPSEKKSRLSPDAYKAIVENINVGIAVYEVVDNGTDFIFRDFNKTAEKIYKQKKEELIGISIFRARPGVGESGLPDVFRRVFETGKPEFFPVEQYNDKALAGWYDNYVFKLPSGEIAAVIEDASGRRLAEDKIRQNEMRFRNLVSSIANYFYTVNIKDGRPVSTIHGPGCLSVTGYSPEEYSTDPTLWFRMVFDEDRGIVMKHIEAVLSGNEVAPVEHRIIHKDGDIRWVRNKAVLKKVDGRLVSYDGLVSDITEQKKAEIALKISEEKYRNIFERSVEGIYQCGPDSRYISINPAFAKMLGYESPDELIETITDIRAQVYVNPSDLDYINKKCGESGSIGQHEVQLYCKDKQKIWVSLSRRIISDNSGNVKYYEGNAVNITERKLALEEKEKLQAELFQAQKMEALGTFTGGVAHDFNNILSVLIGYADLMRLELDEANPLRAYLDPIISSAQKAAKLTKALLSFSRKQPVSLQLLDLNESVRNTFDLLRRLFMEDTDLSLVCTEEDAVIMGDQNQIDQVLFNLATNSRDAMQDGGSFRIETRVIEITEELHTGMGPMFPGKYVLLSVLDTGKGMGEDVIRHIFDPFYTTKETGKGTGLGLSTVYGIIKQHNGHIIGYSEPDVGTNFRIYFPAVAGPVKKITEFRQEISRGHETILIAEDDFGVRSLIATILSSYGYNMIESADGTEAVNKFREIGKVDLLILDSVMPGRNGRQVYDIIKTIDPQIKALFISGYTRDMILDNGIKDNRFDFLSKPVEPLKLVRKVRDVLDK